MSTREQWTAPEGLVKAEQVLAALVTGQPLEPLDLFTVDGRSDLRGFVVPEPVAPDGVVDLQGYRLDSVDFTGASLARVGLQDMDIENCVFDGADCAGIRVEGTNFRDCRFRGTNLGEASLGVTHDGRRTEYLNVEFTEADLTRAKAIEAHFRGCEFANARFNKANFMGSSFEDCHFAGDVEDVLFYGRAPMVAIEHGHDGSPNRMARVDLRDATLRFVGFRQLDLREAYLPRNDDHVVLRPFTDQLTTLLEALRRDPRPAARRLVVMLGQSELQWALDGQDTGVVQLSNFHRDERALLLKMLEEQGITTGKG